MNSGFHEKALKVTKLGLSLSNYEPFEFLFLLQKLKQKDSKMENRVSIWMQNSKEIKRNYLIIFQDFFHRAGNSKMEFLVIFYKIKQSN